MAYMLPSALQYDLMPDDFFEPIPYVLFGQRLLELLNVPLALKREVSEQLHAEFIAGGTIDWTGDRYRLTLRVHEVATGSLATDASPDREPARRGGDVAAGGAGQPPGSGRPIRDQVHY